ncbi:hypothetical protein IFM89_026144 [Coptis chinensis]|uniref:Polygalacturonase n=1 Tax=Coptis chinensis TaxID=261450 RepID=A0A835M6M2_9MAGN|nr:hypothetical protein IFM89_026144 [Coptis chinensis]
MHSKFCFYFQAFLNAWNAMCGAEGNFPTLVVPAGKTFLLGPVIFEGPCKSKSPHVSLLGNLIAPRMSAWASSDKSQWLQFSQVNGLIVDGQGQVDGQGKQWWECERAYKSDDMKVQPSNYDNHDVIGCKVRPTSLSLHACNNTRLSGITSINSPRNHLSINEVHGAIISYVNLTAPGDSPNTDGIDISASSYIQIEHSFIGTGDDCVAMNSGTSFINITNVACGPGHGISVGSLGKKWDRRHSRRGTCEKLYIQWNDKRCQDKDISDAFSCSIKILFLIVFLQAGTGYVRNISFDQITFDDVQNPILIDQYYCPHNQCQSGGSSNIQVSNVSYTEVHGSTAELVAISLNCSSSVPCYNIFMDGVNIVANNLGSTTFSTCANAQGKSISTKPGVPCLAT